MGYSIRIGNAKPEWSKDDGELWARWSVDPKALDDAPTFPNDEMTGNGNCRSPSYSGWAYFCRDAGIYDLFLEKWEGLMSPHPSTLARLIWLEFWMRWALKNCETPAIENS